MSSPDYEPDRPDEDIRTAGDRLEDLPAEEPHSRSDNPVLSWARAIALGIRDTAQDMLDEGRRGAREAQEAGWTRFDNKTKYRRSGKRGKR